MITRRIKSPQIPPPHELYGLQMFNALHPGSKETY